MDSDEFEPGRPRAPRKYRSKSSPPRRFVTLRKKRQSPSMRRPRRRFFGGGRKKRRDEKRVLPASLEASPLCESQRKDDGDEEEGDDEASAGERGREVGEKREWQSVGFRDNRRSRMKLSNIFPRARSSERGRRRGHSAERAIMNAHARIQKSEEKMAKIVSKTQKIMSTAEKVRRKLQRIKPRWGTVDLSKGEKPQEMKRASSTGDLSAEQKLVAEELREIEDALGVLGKVPDHKPKSKAPKEGGESDETFPKVPTRKASPEPPRKKQEMEIQDPMKSPSKSKSVGQESDNQPQSKKDHDDLQKPKNDGENGRDDQSKEESEPQKPTDTPKSPPKTPSSQSPLDHLNKVPDGSESADAEKPPENQNEEIPKENEDEENTESVYGDGSESILTYPTTPSRAARRAAESMSFLTDIGDSRGDRPDPDRPGDESDSPIVVDSDVEGLDVSANESTSETHRFEEKSCFPPCDSDGDTKKSPENTPGTKSILCCLAFVSERSVMQWARTFCATTTYLKSHKFEFEESKQIPRNNDAKRTRQCRRCEVV